MRRFQLAGHRPIGLVGGATGLIGDPSGKSAERVLNPHRGRGGLGGADPRRGRRGSSTSAPARPGPCWSATWTGPQDLSALDFLRDIGKHFPVNQMLSRESVRARLESGGISYTEFSYQILQAYDYLELHRRHGCALQIGGSDQWGNLVAGVDLIRRVTGDQVHALATPLITKPDGTKYGKTEGGAIWLSPDLMSPYAFYQFWINRADAEVPGLLRVFTFRSRDEIEALERDLADRPAAREAQRVLAEDVTTLVHGADECARVGGRQPGPVRPGGAAGPGRGDAGRGAGRGARGDAAAGAAAGRELPKVADLLAEAGHRAEQVGGPAGHRRGRRVPEQRQGDRTPTSPRQASDLLHGRFLVLRRGKRTIAGVQVGE